MTKHTNFLKEAINEAKKALKTNDIPVGCIAVKDGKIIARAHNEKEKKNDATFHAELLCLQKAAKKLGTWRLNNVDIYTTLEPCPMCAGAMVLARIKALIIGTMDPKAGASGSIMNITFDNRLNHKVEIIKGISGTEKEIFKIAQEECSEILKAFFRNLRKDNKKGADKPRPI